MNRAITRDICREYGLGVVGKHLEIRVHSVSTVCAWPSKHLFTKYLISQLHVNCLPPFQSHSITPNPQLSLAKGGI